MEIPNNAEQGVINYVPQEQIRYNQTTKRKPQLIITFPNQDENENERVEIYQITKKSTALNMQGRYNIYWNCANHSYTPVCITQRQLPVSLIYTCLYHSYTPACITHIHLSVSLIYTCLYHSYTPPCITHT